MRVTLFSAAGILGLSLAVPFAAVAQAHGGGSAGHGSGVGSRSAPSRGPMVSGSSASRTTGPGRSGAHSNYSARPLTQYDQGAGNWTSSGFIPLRNQNGSSGRDRNRHVGYGNGAVGYSFFPYSGGYWDGGTSDINDDPNDPNQQPAIAQPDSYADNNPPQVPYIGPGSGYPPPYAQDNARTPYNPNGTASNGNSASDGLKHPEITLIFRDGRAPMHIQNYAMSQTKVFVRDDGEARDIAISDLDIPATMQANDQAGVDFELPITH